MIRAALVLSVVDTCTGELHLVAIETAALHRRSGRYPALCGAEVPAASLTTASESRCQDCEAYAKASLKKYRPIAARNEDKKVCSGLL